MAEPTILHLTLKKEWFAASHSYFIVITKNDICYTTNNPLWQGPKIFSILLLTALLNAF